MLLSTKFKQHCTLATHFTCMGWAFAAVCGLAALSSPYLILTAAASYQKVHPYLPQWHSQVYTSTHRRRQRPVHWCACVQHVPSCMCSCNLPEAGNLFVSPLSFLSAGLCPCSSGGREGWDAEEAFAQAEWQPMLWCGYNTRTVTSMRYTARIIHCSLPCVFISIKCNNLILG